jgi:hypothetical protein
MRCAWIWIVAAACSGAPAEEQLPSGPPPSPRSCKDVDLVETMQTEHATTNQALVHDAFAAYESAHGLTENEQQPLALRMDEAASLELPRDGGVFEAHGRWMLMDDRFGHDRDCAVLLDHEDRLAHGADGAPVLVQVHVEREWSAHVEQCGSCTVGCGIPWSEAPIVWTLPVTAAPTVVDAGTVTLDELTVSCEREVPAQ